MTQTRRHVTAAVAVVGAIAISACSGTEAEEDGWDTETNCLSCSETLAAMSAPDHVDFEKVEVGEQTTETVEIKNTGDAELQIRSLGLVEGTEDDIEEFQTSGDWPDERSIQPGDALAIEIAYAPKNRVTDTGAIRLETNDARRENQNAKITLRAPEMPPPEMPPCLAASPAETLSFRTQSIERTATETVTLGNCRPEQADLTIRRIELVDDAGGGFSLDEASVPDSLADGGEHVLEGDERVDLQLTYQPEGKPTHQGELLVVTDDPARRRHKIQLIGKATPADCPSAIAQASIRGERRQTTHVETVPRKTVQLDGTASNDPDGSIERYEWSIIERPQGSTARLSPSSTVAEPELFLDRAGTYRIELIVYDEDGEGSDCRPPPVVEIEACPCGDLHVQLIWETPNDPDPTDGKGANLDLHYLHPKGTWGETPYDIYWNNKTADWGEPDDASDDPSLDIDDTDGRGPENLVHNGLVSGQTYSVGVYYRDDAGFGPSYATVRIYGNGKILREYKNKYLEPGQFWEVALVERPMLEVDNRDQVYDGFPERGR